MKPETKRQADRLINMKWEGERPRNNNRRKKRYYHKAGRQYAKRLICDMIA